MAKEKKLSVFVFFIFLFLMHITASASETSFGPLSFEPPDNWSCAANSNGYRCLENISGEKRTSILYIIFKPRTPNESLDTIKDYLSRPRVLNEGDTKTPSQVIEVNRETINGIVWVKAIHFGSENFNSYTHYYATIAGGSSILVEFLIKKSTYQKYLPIFNNAISTLKLNVAQTTEDLSAPAIKLGDITVADGIQTINKKIEIFGYKLSKFVLYMGAGIVIILVLLIFTACGCSLSPSKSKKK
ncbi:MAG: hypothetical protein A2Z20_06680 [Bdellovibrionales bacterium RBG_16_40_8]|nr:MAG: hypothetical protein A2Z20_06680 [Bdellovibrionales bacterium RBG_16_40_8]